MLPYKSLIQINRSAITPLFLQLSNQLVQLIQNGQLVSGSKLPSSRGLAEICQLNRNTINKSYQELESLGWITIQAKKGAFVVDNFPHIKTQSWANKQEALKNNTIPNFSFYKFPFLKTPKAVSSIIGFDDGLPDIRLAPIEDLGKAYIRNLRQLGFEKKLSYTDALGPSALKYQLSKLLNETRGLNTTEDNILITRGSTMAIHLAVAATIKNGDTVIVGESNYKTANMMVQHFGGQLKTVPLDDKGIQLETIPTLCKHHRVRAIYVTSHHHHPTTVTLSAERRMKLMQLANQYNFCILEDDYDYDFHYDNSPVLPLASGDPNGRVIHFGSFSKLIAPAFRVGYLVASKELISSVVKLRRIFDRQGDVVLETAIAELMEKGIIRRHKKKSWRVYKERRDYCCDLLEKELGDFIQFERPSGGMAIWAIFNASIGLPTLSKQMYQRGIYLSDGVSYQSINGKEPVNGVRMGFASMNKEEIRKCVSILKEELLIFQDN